MTEELTREQILRNNAEAAILTTGHYTAKEAKNMSWEELGRAIPGTDYRSALINSGQYTVEEAQRLFDPDMLSAIIEELNLRQRLGLGQDDPLPSDENLTDEEKAQLGGSSNAPPAKPKSLFERIVDAFTDAFNSFVGAIGSFVAAVGAAFSDIGEAISSFFGGSDDTSSPSGESGNTTSTSSGDGGAENAGNPPASGGSNEGSSGETEAEAEARKKEEEEKKEKEKKEQEEKEKADAEAKKEEDADAAAEDTTTDEDEDEAEGEDESNPNPDSGAGGGSNDGNSPLLKDTPRAPKTVDPQNGGVVYAPTSPFVLREAAPEVPLGPKGRNPIINPEGITQREKVGLIPGTIVGNLTGGGDVDPKDDEGERKPPLPIVAPAAGNPDIQPGPFIDPPGPGDPAEASYGGESGSGGPMRERPATGTPPAPGTGARPAGRSPIKTLVAVTGIAFAGLVGVLIANAVIGAVKDDPSPVVSVGDPSTASTEVDPAAGDPAGDPGENKPSSGMAREPSRPAQPGIVVSPSDRSSNGKDIEAGNSTTQNGSQPRSGDQVDNDEELETDRYGAPPGRAPVGGGGTDGGDD